MRELYSPRDFAELALIKSLLSAEGIRFHVRNEHFSALNIGPRIELLNVATVLVDPEQFERARELLASAIDSPSPEDAAPAPRYSLGRKLRLIAETLLFMWIVPGNPRRRGEEPMRASARIAIGFGALFGLLLIALLVFIYCLPLMPNRGLGAVCTSDRDCQPGLTCQGTVEPGQGTCQCPGRRSTGMPPHSDCR